MEKYDLVAKTLHGLEGELEKELEQLGAENISTGNRIVSFSGDKELLYKANYHSRLALSVLKPITTFKFTSKEELIQEVENTSWEDYFAVNKLLSMQITLQEARSSEVVVNESVKEGIVKRFRKRMARRPLFDRNNSDVKIVIHVSGNTCHISLDSSGDSLNKRGYLPYKQEQGIVNEVLASGMIALSGWDKKSNLIDPFCQDGVLLFEGLMSAIGIASGCKRNDYGFEQWADFDKNAFGGIREKAISRIERPKYKVIGMNPKEAIVEEVKETAQKLMLGSCFKMQEQKFIITKNKLESGTIVSSLPYDITWSEEDSRDFYQTIGIRLKKSYQNFNIWFLMANKDAIEKIGLPVIQEHEIIDGVTKKIFVNFNANIS